MSKMTGETQDNAIRLPKNIQQIGNAGNGVKVYFEDYSGTYVRRILTGDEDYHAVFLGRRQTDKNQTYIFIQAVIAVQPQRTESGWKYDWNHVYEIVQKYFIEEDKPSPEILGWAMAVKDAAVMDLQQLEQSHCNNFQENTTLSMILDEQDGGEQFYVWENQQFHALDGYYIYYEKNMQMQTYVLENQPGPCVETEELYKGSRESYRTILMRRKEAMQRRHTVSILYVASTFLIMVVVVLGISMMNNYEKMQNMQETLGRLSKSVLNEEKPYAENASEMDVTHSSVVEKNKLPSGGVADVVEGSGINPAVTQMPDVTAQENNEQTAVSAMSQTVTQVQESEPSEMPSDTDVKPCESAQPHEAENSYITTTSGRKQYEIQPGDTLLGISMKLYNTAAMLDKICEYNDIDDGDQIVAGDVLLLP